MKIKNRAFRGPFHFNSRSTEKNFESLPQSLKEEQDFYRSQLTELEYWLESWNERSFDPIFMRFKFGDDPISSLDFSFSEGVPLITDRKLTVYVKFITLHRNFIRPAFFKSSVKHFHGYGSPHIPVLRSIFKLWKSW